MEKLSSEMKCPACKRGTLRRRVEALQGALKEWVDYFDELDRFSEDGDPMVGIRQRVHGKRVAKSRALLADPRAEGESK